MIRRREGPLPQMLPSLAPPSRVTIPYQPPRVVLLNGRFWMWPGRSRSPEPLGSHWPFPEPQGRPQGLSYSPGLHRSPCNKGLRPRQCINKGALSGKQGSEAVMGGGGRREGVAASWADSFLPEERSGFQLLEEKGQRRGTTPCHRHSVTSSRQQPGSPQDGITLPRGGSRPEAKSQTPALSSLIQHTSRVALPSTGPLPVS